LGFPWVSLSLRRKISSLSPVFLPKRAKSPHSHPCPRSRGKDFLPSPSPSEDHVPNGDSDPDKSPRTQT
jgi:hypothetical protein